MKLQAPHNPLFWMALGLGIAGLAIFVNRDHVTVDEYQPINTQPVGAPLSAIEAVRRIQVPDGFQVTLAAAEPDVRQPIAISYDDRGRLWVAESYSYDGSDFTKEENDRILIFEDTNGDGAFDRRTIFKAGLNRLTGIVWGFGGVWVAAAPNLMFIPDRDGDDRPDGGPIIHLDGWTLKAEHNSVNGLMWGPDGWLYGRHGIKETSRPGRPGTPLDERPHVSCSIWRYHPTDHRFEVVVDGTINPWGLDFDDHGQMFMNTSVVDHLWHVVPGSHFARWQDRELAVHAHVYELMQATSDHSHRPIAVKADAEIMPGDDGSGGGHSHVEVMIYLGDRWPESYRGALFMNNIMGRRVNRERLVRDGGDGRFIAKHEPDFLQVNDPWFRGLSFQYGPDGDVILTDWSDHGECHDRDGVHRSSGRIYKISWGAPRRIEVAIERASNEELVSLQLHRNDWFVRHARRLLQERAHGGADMTTVHTALRRLFFSESAAPQKLRALWALHVTNGTDAPWLTSLLDHAEESVRYWAIRLLVDRGPPLAFAETELMARAQTETSWLVRMGLASALTSVSAETRWHLGSALATRIAKDEDPNLVRLLWSGWQSSVPAASNQALVLAPKLRSPRLRQWLPRRLAEAAAHEPTLAGRILETIANTSAPEVQTDLMSGMEAGMANRDYAITPATLAALQNKYFAENPSQRLAALFLGTKLRDPEAIDQLREELLHADRPPALRTRILQAITPHHPDWLVDDLLQLVERGELLVPSLRALAAIDDRRIAPALLARYDRFEGSERSAAINTLLARSASLNALLDAIAAGRVSKGDITQFQARQAAGTADQETRRRFEEIWGTLNPASTAIAAQIRGLRMILKDQEFMRTANLEQGRASFEQRCASCHTLFDRGGKLGPDLTGSGRKDLEYLLINILDPNAAIPADWRLTIVTLTDGRTLSGSITAEHDNAVILQTAEGTMTLERPIIRSIDRLNTSLMPAGLVDDMTPEQVRDLFAFLMSDTGRF